MSALRHVPVDFDEACAFVERYHRHNNQPKGYKFAIGAVYEDDIVGVVIVGRPVARLRQDGLTLEVTRLCADDQKRVVTDRRGKQHPLPICSFLYACAANAAFALGYERIGTYILSTEPGTSLSAAGWKQVSRTRGGTWDTRSRPRVDRHPTIPKLLWETKP